MTQEELKKLQQHLQNPHGIDGLTVGENMNESNGKMISKSISYLELKPNQTVLEIGHGNAEHVQEFFLQAPKIAFYGLEISETMWREAQKRTKGLDAQFHLYDGVIIPFDVETFDRIISVNTLYFWSYPQKMLNEIEQTLKPKGLAVITFMHQSFMENLSFVGEEFKLYSKKDFEALVEKSNLKIIDFKDEVEKVKSKSGEMVERKYSIYKLGK
ncbi:methyltransferase domain-containing protein [Flavobacteriaceae bacterium Ap0902]|nr:methyltransferase domain-containing protein [Flavobacteriaceae bacterium Ap0902]